VAPAPASEDSRGADLERFWSDRERNTLLVWAETTTTMTFDLQAAVA
jgi:hypothetical protein